MAELEAKLYLIKNNYVFHLFLGPVNIYKLVMNISKHSDIMYIWLNLTLIKEITDVIKYNSSNIQSKYFKIFEQIMDFVSTLSSNKNFKILYENLPLLNDIILKSEHVSTIL